MPGIILHLSAGRLAGDRGTLGTKALPTVQGLAVFSRLTTKCILKFSTNFTSFLCGEQKERSKICSSQEPHEIFID